MKAIYIWPVLAFLCGTAYAQMWSSLDQGTDGWVTSLCEFEDGYLLVGGNFSNANGISSPGYAEWSNSTWWGFSPGTDYPVHSIFKDVSDGMIYMGGEFLSVSGVSANRIAYYDGNNWNAMGAGLPASVNKIIRYNGDILAGTVAGLYRWDGSTWSEMNLVGNPYVIVLDMQEFQGKLIVGGSFDTADGNTVNGIAAWDGSSWSGVGTGLDVDGMVESLEIYENELYIGGIFSSFNGVSAGSFAKWDGVTASAVGSGVPVTTIGLPNRISTLYSMGGVLYVGGYFSEINGVTCSNIASFSGGFTTAMGSGLNDHVFNMISFESGLIVGGAFTASGATTLNYIARWDPAPAGLGELTNAVKVYPNPGVSDFTAVVPSGVQHLTVSTLQGKVLWDEQGDMSEMVKVPAADWSPGVYFVSIEDGAGEIATVQWVRE